MEQNNSVKCSSEAAIQLKTEVDDEDCEVVYEMASPPKAARFASECEMEAFSEVKSEDEDASRICEDSLNSRQDLNSEKPSVSFSEEEQGEENCFVDEDTRNW